MNEELRKAIVILETVMDDYFYQSVEKHKENNGAELLHDYEHAQTLFNMAMDHLYLAMKEGETDV